VNKLKDYLNFEERNQFLVMMSILQLIQGSRSVQNIKIKPMIEDWNERNNLTKEEHKYLKTTETYLSKFCNSVHDRMSLKEQEVIDKRIRKFDFRLIDDYTLKNIYRDINDKLKNAVVPRQQFETWCEEIMECNCKGCTKPWTDCKLHRVFDNNFVPESSWGLQNCRYAYQKIRKKVV
jgi:hypothetical protein